ncbi:MAG: metalloregulator ArsR/SmtB family transcription factor [Anaerolineae bacterium]|nr:metalloregulator ArsR/SmtB family transcription factor [Anaerolineae bacterium]
MNYSSIYELQAELCRAMSHAARIEILHTLKEGPKRVIDIAREVGVSQVAVSRHLAVLRHGGIVLAQRQGQDVIYSVANPKILEVCSLMRDVLSEQAAHRSELIQTFQDKS